MGKKSRQKKERKEQGFSGKELKNLRRKSTPFDFGLEDGTVYNPIKKLTKGETYKSEEALAVLEMTVTQTAAYLKRQSSNRGEG